MKSGFSINKKLIKNTRDTDIIIKDAYGKEHMIYPDQEKLVDVLDKDIDDDRS